VVFKDGQEVRLLSRDDRRLGRYFPELVSVLQAALVDRFVADGEIVVVMGTGLGFDELLQRIHPAESRVRKLAAEWPATLVLFDALARDDGISGPCRSPSGGPSSCGSCGTPARTFGWGPSATSVPGRSSR